MPNAVLYTDGSATIRPDGTFLCGYAYVFVMDGKPIYGKAHAGTGTINQAELCAVYAGMFHAQVCGLNITEVYTDSTYVVNGLRDNYEKYDTNEWVTSQGSEVSNKELWTNLIEFTRKYNITIPVNHIKGHTGQPFNELCDKLAKEAAMSQKPVTEYFDVDACATYLLESPFCIEPFPHTSTPGEPTTVEFSQDLVEILKGYTDDRAKCCYINYADSLKAFVSKGVSEWISLSDDDNIGSTYTLHPVKAMDGTELPLYRYMTEVGTPFEVITQNSTIQWQGDDFLYALTKAVYNVDDDYDLIIASYNLASVKKYQGIYFILYSKTTGDTKIVSMYRTERIPTNKFMYIPNGYLRAIQRHLAANTAIGLTVNTSNLCMIISCSSCGLIIGSSVLPHTIQIADCMTINVDKPDKPFVRVTDTDSVNIKSVLEEAIGRAVPTEDLSNCIPKQDYIKPAVCMDAMAIDPSGEVKENVISSDDTIYITESSDEYVDCFDHLEVDIKMYQAIQTHIEALFKEQTEVFDRILNTIRKYPPMTPEKVAEIEKRTRDEMLDKFNSMFK